MGEVGATNCVENYSLDKGEKAVQICFQYAFPSSKDSKGLPLSPREMRMRGNLLTSTHWTIDPKVWGFTLPIGLNYLLLHVDEAEGYCMVGVPDRSYLWIMTRDTPAEFKEAGLKVTDVYDLGNLGTERQAEGDFIKHEVERDSPSIAQQAQQAKAKKTKEGEVLKRAVKRASELGYDVDKIQRCMWFEADREGKGEKTGAEGEKGGSEGDKGETGDLAPAEPVAK
ncbi:hypothetical protein B484DRAFT_262713 [Ochromonadaceae sp. CCMP2298]|nr:hypothetical protein B484DRAFT_262713 [Ochromonadaceae sp. CCMP2298]